MAVNLPVPKHGSLVSFVNAVHGFTFPYFALNLLYGQVAIVCVLVGFGAPEDWPPLNGRLKDATSIRRYWNTWWHQLLRHGYQGWTNFVVKTLRIQKGSRLSAYTQLYFSFLLSATWHGFLMLGLTHGPNATMWDRYWSWWTCFALQAPVIQFEDFIIGLTSSLFWRRPLRLLRGRKKRSYCKVGGGIELLAVAGSCYGGGIMCHSL